MKWVNGAMVLVLAGAVSCERKHSDEDDSGETGETAESDTDTDSDTDSDSDSDTDTDTDTDTDSDTDTDTEGDTDTDTDTDSDTDTDTDTDTTPACSTPVTLPYHQVGGNWEAAFPQNRPLGTGAGCAPSVPGKDGIFAVQLAAGDRLIAEEDGNLDAVIRVSTTCGSGSCLSVGDVDDVLGYTATTAGTYYVSFEAQSLVPDPDNFDISIALGGAEDCDDFADNDEDGDEDCTDADCFGDAACPSGSCLAVPVTLPYQREGLDFFADYADTWDYGLDPDSSCNDGDSHEAVFQLSLTQGQTVVIEDRGSLDVIIRVQQTCDPTGACLASLDEGDHVEFTPPTTGTYYAIVESATDFQSVRDYDIRIGIPSAETCANDFDDDFDGDADCDDLDCFGDANCPNLACYAEEVEISPFTVTGSNFKTDFDNNYWYALADDASCLPTGTNFDGDEAVYLLSDLVAGEQIHVVQSGGMPGSVKIQAACRPDGHCFANESPGSGPEEVLFTVTTPGDYYVILESVAVTPVPSDYDLTIEVYSFEDCAAAGDEDHDGFANCLDPDCFDVGACGWTDVVDQPFDAGISPWTVVNGGNNSTNTVWTWCAGTTSCFTDKNNTAITLPGADGGYTYVTASTSGTSGVSHNETLTSPTFSLTGRTSARLTFNHLFRRDSTAGDLAKVQISVDGGAYQDIVTYSPPGPPPNVYAQGVASIDLATWLDAGTAQVRFTYTSSGRGYYWLVDDIRVVAK